VLELGHMRGKAWCMELPACYWATIRWNGGSRLAVGETAALVPKRPNDLTEAMVVGVMAAAAAYGWAAAQ
jgi:hypothetical protein